MFKSVMSQTSTGKAQDVFLEEFINQYLIKDPKDPFTHQSRDPPRKYFISDDELPLFFAKYSNAIQHDSRPTLMEIPSKTGLGPLRFDFDFKANYVDEATNVHRRYTEEMLQSIILKIQNVIRDVVNIEYFEEKLLYCVVLEKSAPRVEAGFVKDGFHLHFPYMIAEAWVQDQYFRSRIIEHYKSTNLFEECGFIESEYVDDNMAKKPWCLYGSNSKKKGMEGYALHRKYGYGEMCRRVPLNDIFDEIAMYNAQYYNAFIIPQYFSVCGNYRHPTPLVETVNQRPKPRKQNHNIPRKRKEEDIAADLKLIVDGDIMNMISSDRSENYDQWLDVGWTLFCIGEGCQEALDLWLQFSRTSSKFIEAECVELWNKMELKGKSIGSLFAMAKNDNPALYKAWRKSTIDYHLYQSLFEQQPSEGDIAEVIKHLYYDRFVCVSASKKLWYEFRGHRWHKVDDAVSLKRLFRDDVKGLYMNLKSEIVQKQLVHKDNEEEIARLEKQEKKCSKIISSLKTVTFTEKLMKMCIMDFHDEKFLTKLDENKQLFGCENGVLDLTTGLFREGRPEDYISKTCGLNYNIGYTWDDEDVKRVTEFYRKIFPDPDLRSYFYDAVCSCLEGGNTNKIFLMHTGESDGGKSANMKFLEYVFGEYMITFPSEMFIKSGKVSSAQARPELIRSKGARIAKCQEVSKTDDFDPRPIKELSGNDGLYVRGLYSDGGEFTPQFTLWICCNEPPKIPAHDAALWTRTRLLPYESKFVKPSERDKYPVPDTEEERMKLKRWVADDSIGKEFRNLAPALLWILFNRFSSYKIRGLKDAAKVRMSTDKYRHKNDVYLQFIDECIEKVENPTENDVLKLNVLFEEFKRWYKECDANYSKEKMTKVTVSDEITKHLGTSTKVGRSMGWKGYRIIEE